MSNILQIKLLNIKDSTEKIDSIYLEDKINGIKVVKTSNGVLHFIERPEAVIQYYFNTRGYMVFRLTSNWNKKEYDCMRERRNKDECDIWDKIYLFLDNYILTRFDKYSKIKSYRTLIQYKGVPDFLIVKINNKVVEDVFFVEVKTEWDSLRMSQIEWICKCKSKVLIAIPKML